MVSARPPGREAARAVPARAGPSRESEALAAGNETVKLTCPAAVRMAGRAGRERRREGEREDGGGDAHASHPGWWRLNIS